MDPEQFVVGIFTETGELIYEIICIPFIFVSFIFRLFWAILRDIYDFIWSPW